MNDREYFVVAVTIAIIIPCMIGGMYFYNMYNKHLNSNLVSKLDGRDEINLFGEYRIDEELSHSEIKVYDFEVKYSNGKSKYKDYSIFLSDVNFVFGNNKIKWKINSYDEFGNKNNLGSGTLDGSNKQIILSNKSIKIGESQRFTLDLDCEIVNEKSEYLMANIVLE